MNRKLWLVCVYICRTEPIVAVETRDDAFALARSAYARLTSLERNSCYISVEEHTVPVPDGDTRSVEQVYADYERDDPGVFAYADNVYEFQRDFQ